MNNRVDKTNGEDMNKTPCKNKPLSMDNVLGKNKRMGMNKSNRKINYLIMNNSFG